MHNVLEYLELQWLLLIAHEMLSLVVVEASFHSLETVASSCGPTHLL
jgi:hypothetical protein